MSITESRGLIKQQIMEKLPSDVDVTKIEFEGPEIAVYTRNPKFLIENDILKDLARRLRKRIVPRSDPSVRMVPEEAEIEIKSIVPEDAEISGIFWDHIIGEVTIEAKKPGLVIGRNGTTLKEIKRKIIWRPSVIRTPPISSKIILQLRHLIQKENQERQRILKRVGGRIHRPLLMKGGFIRITSLGGFREVGRTCVLVQTEESNVLVDCGVNVGSSSEAFPRLDLPEFDLENLDAIVITHAHLDHSGFVPFLFKYGFDGSVYCTKATRNLMTLLQLDYLDVAEREGKLLPYDQKAVKKLVLHTIPLDYGEVTDIAPDIRLTLHNAGHILGSAIAHLHIGDGLYNIAYTGDFKYMRSRLLEPASTKFPRLEALITESTYGGNTNQDLMPSRNSAERQLVNLINSTVKRKGIVLIPVLAVGRAQELIIVLEEYIRRGIIEEIPIYIDGMISEATAIHTTHPEYLARDLREKIFHRGLNPFLADCFTQVDSVDARMDIVEGEPSIIMAPSGMLTGGPSVEYFRLLAPEEKNCIIFVSYQVDGTLGWRIQKGWREIPMIDRSKNGRAEITNVKMEIGTVDGFSGHSDRKQLLDYVKEVTGHLPLELVLCCHGENTKCVNLANTIRKIHRIDARAPNNLETVRLK